VGAQYNIHDKRYRTEHEIGTLNTKLKWTESYIMLDTDIGLNFYRNPKTESLNVHFRVFNRARVPVYVGITKHEHEHGPSHGHKTRLK
jgi:hypothetical protein